MNTCERCQSCHDGTYGSGRFCSVKCARGFSTSLKRSEINEKVRKTLRKEKINVDKQCEQCLALFQTTATSKKRCCNNTCAARLRWKSYEYAKNQIQVLNQVRKPWMSRKKCVSSFPEKCVAEWLTQRNISYIREHKVGRWFVDFAIIDRKIALEVDGKQHELIERKTSDEEKDAFLTLEGWSVVRLKWRRLTKQSYIEMTDELFRRLA